jgi:hypothetical protein
MSCEGPLECTFGFATLLKVLTERLLLAETKVGRDFVEVVPEGDVVCPLVEAMLAARIGKGRVIGCWSGAISSTGGA